MKVAEWLRLRNLRHLVDTETNAARSKFDATRKNLEQLPVAYTLTAITEEIGKVNRCHNKLVALEGVSEAGWLRAEQLKWRRELEARIITTQSLLDRLYLMTRSRDV